MNNHQEFRVSKWFLNILLRIYPNHLAEEIIGDLYEQYRLNSQRKGNRFASIRFYLNALGFIRINILKRKKYYKLNNTIMVKNYLKVALRNIVKSKGYSAINIFGLGVGIGSFLMIMTYVHYELSYDKYHDKSDRIYSRARYFQ